MGVGSQARLAGGAILNAGKAMKDAVSAPFKSGNGIKGMIDLVGSSAQGMMNEAQNLASATKPAASGFWAAVGSVIAFPFRLIGKAVAIPFGWGVSGMKASANAGLWVAKKPIEAGLYGVRKGAEFVGSHPVGALVGAGAATVAGAGLWARSRAQRQTMESYQEAAMQLQAMRSPYMNSVTPEESARMQARMRQDGDGGSMAQMEQKRRAAAAQATAPVRDN